MAQEEPWHLDAVIYAIDVKRFADSNGDGIGDFIGLKQKLDYIADLGVTCIWLLPFYRSPGEDNGYDVSDYYQIDDGLGTIEDFLDFLHAAGEHGIRVIIDLVVNHTSNRHPWFEAARRDEKSRYRPYYVWSSDPPPVKGGDKSVFPDQEKTVWTYDEVARAYYYHKFYRFQPDLNTANPDVLEEIERVMDYWLALGVSGFRLDAIPFVIGQNGLREADPGDPAGILERLNRYVQERRPGGIVVGEVNLPPEETYRYFGDGDQLGLLFNFLTPCYIFAALAEEDAARISEALAILPEPPAGCGWANFLRNLDELDFSQVPADIRAAAFEAFAKEEGVIVHDRGIRRRLAPMLEGDQQRIAMALSLMLSLPGASMIVYGDEIGMGDDLRQPDRIGVRIPMQWSAKRNGGFSSAAPSKLIQPAIETGPFSYRSVNVETQLADPGSLLNVTRRLIGARREIARLLRGRPVALRGNNRQVQVRASGNGVDMVLVAHNLSPERQEVDLTFDHGWDADFIDLLGGPKLEGKGGLKLTLPGYGFAWLKQAPPAPE